MLPSIDALDDDTYTHLLAPIWAYLARMDRSVRSDVIFVLGSLDLAVPRRAAKFYTAGLSPHVLVSGWLGSLTEHVLKKSEAVVFQETLIRHGAPGRNITTELNASNTLEKVRFSMRALAARGQTPHSALLMAKTFVMRRCLATFAKQHPETDGKYDEPDTDRADRAEPYRQGYAAAGRWQPERRGAHQQDGVDQHEGGNHPTE